jgi:hypothetical protein
MMIIIMIAEIFKRERERERVREVCVNNDNKGGDNNTINNGSNKHDDSCNAERDNNVDPNYMCGILCRMFPSGCFF